MAQTKREPVATVLAEEETEEAPPTSVLVRWVGSREDLSQVRIITSSDWSTVGVKEKDVTWDTTDPMTRGQALVSPHAAEYLLEIENGFEAVPDDERAFSFRK